MTMSAHNVSSKIDFETTKSTQVTFEGLLLNLQPASYFEHMSLAAAVTDRESGMQVQYSAPFNVYLIGSQSVLDQKSV